MWLFYTTCPFTFVIDKLPWCLKRVWFPSLALPSLFFEERLGGLLKAPLSLPHFSFLHVLLLSPKSLLGGSCMHWRWLSRCLLTGCHWLCLWLPTFWTSFLQWSGWASLLAGEEHLRGLWVSARCMLSSFVSLGFTKSWVGQVALRSCVRPWCFTGRPRPLGTGALNGSMVLSFDLLLPPVRFLTYGFLATGSPPVDGFFKLLCHRQSSLLATRSFLSSPCTNFDPTDFCHLRRRFNWFFNLFVCNFWPERLKMFRFASIHLRPISDYDMLTEGRSARDLLRKKIAP